MKKALLLPLVALAWLAQSASAQTSLYTTADDFAQFDGSTSVVSTVYYSVDSTVNGIGNNANHGGTGGLGSLQLTAAGGWAQWLSGSEFPGMTADAFSALSPGSIRPYSAEAGYGPGTMVASTGIVTFDIYAGNLSSWYQFGVTLNYDGHYDTFNWNSATDFPGADGNTWKHVEVQYTTYAASLSYFGMAFSENSDGTPNAGQTIFIDNFQVQAVPEPSTFALAGFGLAALMVFRRRK